MSRGRFFVAIVLIGLGVVFLLDQLGYAPAGTLLAMWWPVLLILFGLMLLSHRGALLLPAAVTLVGLWLLAGTLGVVAWMSFGMLLPFILILVGVSLLVRSGRTRRRDEAMVDETAVFSGLELHPLTNAFSGGTLTSIFGGITVDLHDAQPIPEGARLVVSTAFGGVTLLVPETWRVTVHGLPMFGGWSDKVVHPTPLAADAPRLDVDVMALFGGVEVRGYEPTPKPFARAA